MNRQHTRTYRRRTRLGLPAAALGLAAATVAAAWAPAHAAPGTTAFVSTAGQRAHAELAALTLSPVAPLGIGRFHGTYGIADSSRAGTSADGDFTDPDGVLAYLTVTGRKVIRTADVSARASAWASIPGVTLKAGGAEWAAVRPKAGSTGAPETHAECAPPPASPSSGPSPSSDPSSSPSSGPSSSPSPSPRLSSSSGPAPQAFARTDANEVRVLGHPVPRGTTTLHVTGAELRHPSTVGNSTLTVTYEEYRRPLDGNRAREHSARAGLRLRVAGTIRSIWGGIAYQGDIVDLRLGEVTADCGPTGSPASTPAGSAPGPEVRGPASPTPRATPTPSASPSPAAVPPAPGAPGMPGPGAGASAGGPGMLAGTGIPAATWLLGLATTLVVAGTGLVLRARRDIRAWGS